MTAENANAPEMDTEAHAKGTGLGDATTADRQARDPIWDRGYIPIPRSLIDHPVWRDRGARDVYLELVARARYTGRPASSAAPGRRRYVELDVGQAVCGVRDLSDTLGVTPRVVRTSLTRLTAWSLIAREPTHQGSVVSLRGYSEFWAGEESERHTNRTTTATTTVHTTATTNRTTTATTTGTLTDTGDGETEIPRDGETTKKSRKRDPSAVGLSLADRLKGAITTANPAALLNVQWTEARRRKWATEFERLERKLTKAGVDNAAAAIEGAITWVHGDQGGSEARFVVESPASLTKKWDRVFAAMNRPAATPQQGRRYYEHTGLEEYPEGDQEI